MSPASPSLPSSDSRPKWQKRKRDSSSSSNLKRQKNQEDDDDNEEDEDNDEPEDYEDNNRDSPANNLNADPILDLRGSEVLLDSGQRISDFPVAVKRSVNRPHPSVIAVVAAEKYSRVQSVPNLENISYGQLQAVSSVSRDNPIFDASLDQDKAAAYVCSPPALMEGKGVRKRFGDGKVHLVPMHSDWFSPTTVNRLERQVVPHFFSGKSADHTPERYMALRNKIISRYLENPGKRLALADCQGLVTANELYDLSRIVRFLDHWGIINYLVPSQRLFKMASTVMFGSLIKEDVSGEIHVQTNHLRSIDSLILFDRPKSSVRLEDVGLLASSSSDRTTVSEGGILDLDAKIRERLSEHACSYCLQPLPHLHYQSQKEADTILCSDCFHDAKFIVGHSSIDFVRVDSKNDASDLNGDAWTDQETLLLLEGLEKYNDNWNEITEYVGTKSKAQCILHFLRLPMEDGLLENIEVMPTGGSSDSSNWHGNGLLSSNRMGDIAGICPQEPNSGNQIPFADSANPVMSLVAFLASAIAPRVAAACASASLAVLTKGDSRNDGVGPYGAYANLGQQKDATITLDPELVKVAAMSGLSAAATKAKLFADQEEREVQRLAANIINNQLKKLELKLKQFAELETMITKECEQIEKTRQRLSTERVRIMSARFGPTAVGPTTSVNANPRPPNVSPSIGQSTIPPTTFSNNILPTNHPHMQFMQRQQQMYGFGPRLPLSAIHPPSSSAAQNVVFNSGLPNSSTSNHHPLLRSSSGNTSNTG